MKLKGIIKDEEQINWIENDETEDTKTIKKFIDTKKHEIYGAYGLDQYFVALYLIFEEEWNNLRNEGR